jgi:hypothetical protein
MKTRLRKITLAKPMDRSEDNIKVDFHKWDGLAQTGLSGSGYTQVAVCYEHGNEFVIPQN